MTARANFPSSLILKHASIQIEEVNKDYSAKIEAEIVKAMGQSEGGGFLWWKNKKLRTREQAEAFVLDNIHGCGSRASWATAYENIKLQSLGSLKRIAGAAVKAGVETVSIDSDDCFVLRLPSPMSEEKDTA